MLKAIMEPMEQLQEFSLIKEQLKKTKKPIHVTGSLDSGQVHLANAIGEGYKYKVFITFTEKKAKELYEDMKFYGKNVLYYPAKDFIFFSADIHGNLTLDQRLQVVKSIISEEEVTVVTTIDG